MKTKLIIGALFLLLFSAFSPVCAAESEGTIKTILTAKTLAHRKIFELPVYVVLPRNRGFLKTPTGAMDKGSRITLDASTLATPFSTLRIEFEENKLKERGLELKSRSEFLWNGKPALLLKIFQPLDDEKIKGQWVLLIDRKDHCWLINGAYEAKNQSSSAEVLEILQSAWWDENELNDTQGATITHGTIETEGTPFQLAGLSQGAIVYSKDGMMPTQSEDGALFVLSRIHNIYTPVNKRDEFVKEKCNGIVLGDELEVASLRDVTIDKMSGKEIVAVTDNEQEVLVYQTILFDHGTCHVLVGIAYQDHEKNLEYFRTLAESYKLKLSL
ncbi:hypothetical protein LJC40_00875 [Synergistaceae bacterium OttesenSCG-928-D05]|nr:hypothetical protein [Synergistaceae bacterium OttesenSCG-928-D05]